MVFNKLKLLLSCLMLSMYLGYSQTSNYGMFYVKPDTKVSVLQDMRNKPTGELYNDGDLYIFKNFMNDGIVGFNDITGLTRFIGAAPQEIEGTSRSHFYNLFFDNNSEAKPFLLRGEIEVDGLVDFYQGIIQADDYGGKFFFGEMATYTNASDNSFVDGEVYKSGTEEFIFPIGDEFYMRPSAISRSSNTSSYVSKYYLENPHRLYPINRRNEVITFIDDKEYWEIKKLEGDYVEISLTWREEVTPATLFNQPVEGNLGIVRWDEDAQQWFYEGGVIDMDAKTVTTMVDKTGIFTLARVNEELINPCGLVVYNAVTPNEDGINDVFMVDRPLDACTRKVMVKIFNRWGVKVFDTDDYDNHKFRGIAEGDIIIDKGSLLPSGTYFYILEYKYTSEDANAGEKTFKKAGYLYLTTGSN